MLSAWSQPIHIDLREEAAPQVEGLHLCHPCRLRFCHKHVARITGALLLVVVVNDHTNTEVQHEETAYEHEGHEKHGADKLVGISPRLEVGPSAVDGSQHHVHPAFGGADLEERDGAHQEIVEVLVHVHPLTPLFCAEGRILDQAPAVAAARASCRTLLQADFALRARDLLAEVLVSCAGLETGRMVRRVRRVAEGRAAVAATHHMVAPGLRRVLAVGVAGAITMHLADGRVPGGSLPRLRGRTAFLRPLRQDREPCRAVKALCSLKTKRRHVQALEIMILQLFVLA
mmetsp:Transcript_46518/g.108644  ORF Transcript_46518/g.108644 Transcript_46518/m.108644 type:complete len:287 (+) Transcript_46518:1626-2486(+)